MDPTSSRAHPAIWMKRSSSEEPDAAHGSGGRRVGVGAATGFGGLDGEMSLPLPEEDEILDMCVKVARDRLMRDERGGRGTSLGK